MIRNLARAYSMTVYADYDLRDGDLDAARESIKAARHYLDLARSGDDLARDIALIASKLDALEKKTSCPA